MSVVLFAQVFQLPRQNKAPSLPPSVLGVLLTHTPQANFREHGGREEADETH